MPVAASQLSRQWHSPTGWRAGLGGLVAGASADQVLLGRPSQLRRVGSLPQPSHDAAAVLSGGHVWLFGGGEERVSTSSIVRVDP